MQKQMKKLVQSPLSETNETVKAEAIGKLLYRDVSATQST